MKQLLGLTLSLFLVATALCAQSAGRAVTHAGLRVANAAAGIVASRSPVTIIDSNCFAPTPAEDTLRIINTSTTNLDLTGVVAAPANLFTILPPLPAGTLAPGAAIFVHVRFAPKKAGNAPGTLTITSNDPLRSSFTVDLIGHRDTVDVAPATHVMHFNQKLACEPQSDTSITLYNRGDDTARLYPVNITTPFFLVAPPPYIILPHDSIRVLLRFMPNGDGAFTSELRYLVSPCGLRDTVRLSAEQITPTYAITDVAFGSVTVGGSGNATATVTNPTGVTLRIATARVVPGSGEFSVNPAQFPIRIPPGGSAPVTFTYTPTSVGTIAAGVRVEVDIDSICTTRLGAAVTGRAIPAGIELSPDSLGFGMLLGCETAQDTITITNTSAIPITLGAPVVTPGAASAFFSVTGGTFVAGDLAPGASATIIVRFTPGTGLAAVRAAVLRIASSDPLRNSIDIALNGELVNVGVALSGQGFPATGGGGTSTATRWIANAGSSPITIESIRIGPPYSVLSTLPLLPVTLQPGDSMMVTLRFAPPQPGPYADSLRLGIRYSCDTIAYEIADSALDLSVIAATAVWDNAAGAPGDTVRIALRLRDDVTKASVTTFTASAAFNPSLLVPLRIVLDGTITAGWNVIDQKLSPGRARFTAQGAAPIAGTGIIAYLEALVALGDSVATPITGGDSTGVNSPRAQLSLAPGLFTLTGYCPVGGPRLVSAGDGAGLKAVRPNPVTASASVDIHIIERGPTRLVLFDALGRESARVLDADLSPGTYIVTLQAADLPAGLYYLELRTPGTRDRMKVMVK